jgi:cell wall-associated NlpC family hydrolase
VTYLRFVGLLVLVTVLASLGVTGPVAADTDLPIGGQGQVANTDGEGVRIREAPDVASDTLKVLDEGWRVTVLAGPVTGDNGKPWYKIHHGGTSGYILAEFLTTATGATGGLLPGETAQISTDDGTMLRLRAEVDGEVLITMPDGARVPVLAGPATDASNRRWYQLNYEGQKGWALGAYLRPVAVTTTPKEPPARPAPKPPPPPAAAPPAPPPPAPPPPADPPAEPRRTSSGGGATLVAIARQYLGAPYVFGGSTPAGFDCSGLVQYVARKALGINLGRDVYSQWAAGVPVAPGDLQPGDLVFQKNTYRWGLSHVGIYIGGGKMINAQSERVGVKIQDIWDGYWGPRYYGARRIVN